MKAQIILVELITVLIALLISFGILFPRFVYKNTWKEATLMLLSRDLILTMDRTGNLYQYSFDQLALNDFLNKTIREKFLIHWNEVENAFPNRIVVACNCTEEEINEMNFWFNPLLINNRRIYILIQRSSLEEIPQEADVILIMRYKNLTNYKPILTQSILKGIGIVEVMNFDSSSKIDITQTQIFGINCTGSTGASGYMNFSKPASALDMVYLPYKNFFHIPLPLNSSLASNYPENCKNEGNFVINRTNYKFWICNDSYVWFDVDANGVWDKLVKIQEKVTIGKFNFTLSYIFENKSISLSFSNKPEYLFGSYLSVGNCNILPNDGNIKRILIKAVNQSSSREYPAVILNSSKIAWMYDFGNNPSDDEKNLLLSLVLWASRKKSLVLPAQIQRGFSTSYLNVQNKDIFEIYKFTLGLSYPY
ncbi:MAG: hypothetical protein QXL86_00480 [Candidatus Aenigmatarchaeota archaeon]